MKAKSICLIFIFLISNLACSARIATVNGNPPTTPTVNFKSDVLMGTFSTLSTPTTFMWPTTDAEGKRLDREGIIDIRAKIIASSALAEELQAEAKKIEDEVVEPYYTKFVGMKCGLLVDDFFSTPDADARSVSDSDWKTPSNDDEEKAINECKDVQNERKRVYGEQVGPLLLKAKEAQTQTTQLIRNENFLPLDKITVDFGPQPKVILSGFQGFSEDFSTESEMDFYKITDVKMDLQNGYLTFSAPAVRLENEVKDLQTNEVIRRDYMYFGQYTFQIEVSQYQSKDIPNNGLAFGGEIILRDLMSGEERKGRISAVGSIQR